MRDEQPLLVGALHARVRELQSCVGAACVVALAAELLPPAPSAPSTPPAPGADVCDALAHEGGSARDAAAGAGPSYCRMCLGCSSYCPRCGTSATPAGAAPEVAAAGRVG